MAGRVREFRVLENSGWSLLTPWWRCEDTNTGVKVTFAESSLVKVKEGVKG
jgi:hypothetical protein